jgi:hypothetical protein
MYKREREREQDRGTVEPSMHLTAAAPLRSRVHARLYIEICVRERERDVLDQSGQRSCFFLNKTRRADVTCVSLCIYLSISLGVGGRCYREFGSALFKRGDKRLKAASTIGKVREVLAARAGGYQDMQDLGRQFRYTHEEAVSVRTRE